MEKYVEKGKEIAVEGKIVYRTYDDKDGVKRYTTDIRVEELVMVRSCLLYTSSSAHLKFHIFFTVQMQEIVTLQKLVGKFRETHSFRTAFTRKSFLYGIFRHHVIHGDVSVSYTHLDVYKRQCLDLVKNYVMF